MLGDALREEADRAEDPDHHRRHELRLAFGATPRRRSAAARRSAGTSTTTGDGGMTEEERGHSADARLPVPAVALRHEPEDLRRADAIEVVVGQGAKPGGGGMLLGQKISDRVAEMRTCPRASTSAPPAAIPTGPAPTTSRSRSSSCARSPTGRSRSTSRSAARGPITTRRWR